MTSEKRGKTISNVDVGNVTRHGFWLLLDGREAFLSFEDFPWFRDASIDEITTIERPNSHHLYWPKLDIDLAVDSIDHPERYPLVSGAQPKRVPEKSDD